MYSNEHSVSLCLCVFNNMQEKEAPFGLPLPKAIRDKGVRHSYESEKT